MTQLGSMLDVSTLPTDPLEIRQQLYDKMQTQDFVDFERIPYSAKQTWNAVLQTVFGHFCGLYAMYIWENTARNISYGDLFNEIYNQYGQPNTRRTQWPPIYKNEGLGLIGFVENLAEFELTDIDQEVYDWYPASISNGWNVSLGNPKTYPGVSLVYGKTSAPNQTTTYGPYLNYVYRAGRKNAISQNILVLNDRTVVMDYAKYKGAPGFRSRPYSVQQSYQATTQHPKVSYDDWKKMPYDSTKPRYTWRSIQPITGRTAYDPMFYSYRGSSNSSFNQTKRVNPPIPTINYDYRHLDFL